jgi:hypothetical protein
MKSLKEYLNESMVKEYLDITVEWGDNYINLLDDNEMPIDIESKDFKKFTKHLKLDNPKDVEKVIKQFGAKYLMVVDLSDDSGDELEYWGLDEKGNAERIR